MKCSNVCSDKKQKQKNKQTKTKQNKTKQNPEFFFSAHFAWILEALNEWISSLKTADFT